MSDGIRAEEWGEDVGATHAREPEDLSLLLYQPPPLTVLPKALREMVESGAHCMSADPAYVLLPVLAAVSGAVGLSRRVRLSPTWAEPGILWACLLVPSGARKSPPLALAVEPLRRVEDERHQKHLRDLEDFERASLEHEIALGEWRRKARSGKKQPPLPPRPEEPRAPRIIVSDITMEAIAERLEGNPRGLVVVRDELSGWFGSMGQYGSGRGAREADVANWNESHRGGPIVVDRKTGDRRTIRVPHGAVGVVGTIQPLVLQRHLAVGQGLTESGMMARILFAGPPAAIRPPPEEGIAPYVERAYARVIERLAALPMGAGKHSEPVPVDLRLAEDARPRWRAWLEESAAERRDMEEESPLAAAAAKLEGYAARLALILHLARWAEGEEADPGPLDLAAVEGGIALSRWFYREARRLYGSSLKGLEAMPVELLPLVRWIERQGEPVASHDVAQRGPRPYRGKTEHAEAHLQRLASAGLGQWIQPPPAEGRGRPPSPLFQLLGYENQESRPETAFSYPAPAARTSSQDAVHTAGAPWNGALREPGDEGDEE